MVSTMQVLFLTAGVVSLLVAILIFLIFRTDFDRSSRLWVVGSILMASGMALLAYRPFLPNWVAYGATNYIMLQAVILYGYSVISLYQPAKNPSKSHFFFCLIYGLIQWSLNEIGYREYLALIASIAWTIAYAWIWIQMRQILSTQKNAHLGSFSLIALFGVFVWGSRIYLVSVFDIGLSTDLEKMNLVSLTFAHIILIAQQISYLTTRLIDEKEKKDEIARLNSSIEKLWAERQALIEEKEKARDQLLQDVHDGFGSKLISAQILARQGKLKVEELDEYLKELINDLHLLVDTLDHSDQRFADAIADFRHRIQRRHTSVSPKISWRVELEGVPSVNQRVALNLLRIAQEALGNALKHSKAENILIVVVFDPNNSLLTIEISDDGAVWQDTTTGGRGLNNMKKRAKEIGAIFKISSTTERTTVSVQLSV